jgi:hypothetical protein
MEELGLVLKKEEQIVFELSLQGKWSI